MKKIFSLFLCLTLLCSTVVLFASCGKADLSQYSIVYVDGVSDTMLAKINKLAEKLEAATGAEVTVTADKEKDPVENNEKEILIGHTARVESAEALEKIENSGHYTGMIGKKIVLNGSTNYLASLALDDFIATYFGEGSVDASKMAIKEKVVSNIEMLDLSSSFKMVVSHTADNSYKGSSADWGTSSNDNGDDYAMHLARTFRDSVISYVGTLALQDDQSEQASNEVMVGRPVLRAKAKAFLLQMDVNDYGVKIEDGSIVIGALNDTTLTFAMNIFNDIYTDSKLKVDNKTRVSFPASYETLVKGDSDWVVDFPRPTATGLALTGSVDVYDGSLEFLYTGAGATAATYEAYCSSLAAAGYTLHSSNEIEGSYFSTYVNEAANTTLYVAYNSFQNATAQKVKLFEPCIRVISASLDSVNLLPEELMNPTQQYVKVTDTMITNLELDGAGDENVGNCYIITLEDGSFAVLDGGTGDGTMKGKLWKVLADLYKKVWGKAPSETNKIKISMWYLSHGHGDHSNIFYDFCMSPQYASMLELGYLITNFPSDDEAYNCHDPNLHVRNSRFNDVSAKIGGTYIKVHTGQKFYFCNSEFDVLYTHEDMYPWAIQYYNDTGVVIKQTIHDTTKGENGVAQLVAGATPTTMLWLGDVQTRPSQWMRAMYSATTLKSDMLQVSHHGSTGCEYEFYALTTPQVLWWPTYLSKFQSYIKPATGVNDYRVVNSKLIKLSSVKEIILGSAGNATVTITANGPDLRFGSSGTCIYNAGVGYVTTRTAHFVKRNAT